MGAGQSSQAYSGTEERDGASSETRTCFYELLGIDCYATDEEWFLLSFKPRLY